MIQYYKKGLLTYDLQNYICQTSEVLGDKYHLTVLKGACVSCRIQFLRNFQHMTMGLYIVFASSVSLHAE